MTSTNRRKWMIAVSLLISFAGLPRADADAAGTPDERLLAHLQGAYERMLVANPSLATEQGERDGNDRWESIDEAGAAA